MRVTIFIETTRERAVAVQTGTWTNTDSLLALYRFYVDAADDQLKEIGVKREEILDLIRHLEVGESGYRTTELVTIGTQMLRAYRAGKAK